MRRLLFSAVFVALSAGAVHADGGSLLELAHERFLALRSYTARINTYAGGDEQIDYSYRTPGHIRMDFISPHKGTALVYDPDGGIVRLRPFKALKFLVLKLKPTDRLIRSKRGHTVDRSHLGALIDNALKVEASGSSEVIGTDTEDGKEAVTVEVTGREGFESLGVNRYLLWLDAEDLMPLRAEAFDKSGELLEGVRIEGLVLDPELEDSVFEL